VKEAAVQIRPSPGVEQFFGSIHGARGLSLVDFSKVSQASVSLITGLEHKIYFEDLFEELDTIFGDGDFYANQLDPAAQARFLKGTLNFADGALGGALIWDSLEFLSAPLLRAVVERLHRQMRRGAMLLAFFHGEEKAETVPVYTFRLADERSLTLVPRGRRKPAQYFNNRALEKLFGEFQSVKFFLTRDNLREVIVRR